MYAALGSCSGAVAYVDDKGYAYGAVTHIDDKGYVYCTGHGERRRCAGIRKCRKLRTSEIAKLTNGQTIKY